MKMTPQSGSVVSDVSKAKTYPQLSLPPPGTTRTNDPVMNGDHIEALQQWAGGLQGVIEQMRAEHAKAITDLQASVATLQKAALPTAK